MLVIINIYKLCSLFSASVGLCTFGDRLNEVDRCENIHWDKGFKGIDCHSFMYTNRQQNALNYSSRIKGILI